MTQSEIQRIIREEKNKRVREWRRKNPDKVRAANLRYWNKLAEKIAAEREQKQEAADGE